MKSTSYVGAHRTKTSSNSLILGQRDNTGGSNQDDERRPAGLHAQDNCQSRAVALSEEKPNDRIESFGRLLFSHGHHTQAGRSAREGPSGRHRTRHRQEESFRDSRIPAPGCRGASKAWRAPVEPMKTDPRSSDLVVIGALRRFTNLASTRQGYI